MPSIRILPDQVANQIAAGEVIERPAAVVKELLENSLDAGATRIEIEFRHGGRSYIRIEDNGCGMRRDDAMLSLERHATSKLASAVDLDRLSTFGFRGEALPSIASVSRFEMRTRCAADEAGTEILVNAGRCLHVKDCGMPVGTRIVVAQLFNSVPARRKFLRTDATESAHIIQCARLYALAYPQVSFCLIEDGRVIFQSPGCSGLEERVAAIFGRQIAEGLLPVEGSEREMKLAGLVSKPGFGRSSRHEMITFVNRRPVDSRTLSYALIESYQTSLPKGRYPLAFLFLELDPAAVDVNVHPAKREIRFRQEPQVRGFVIRALQERLRPALAPLEGEASPATGGGAQPELPQPSPERFAARRVAASVAPEPARLRGSVPVAPPGPGPVTASPAAGRAIASPAAPDAPDPPRLALPWRYLGETQGVYALFETPSGILLLHRRAALERIWYERIEEACRRGTVSGQKLLFAVPVELDPIGSALLVDHLDLLTAHGFDLCAFGRNFFRIEAVPDWLEPSEAESAVREVVGLLRDGRLSGRQAGLAARELARLAGARAAASSRGGMGERASLDLARELLACRDPLTSPGGIRTYLEIGQAELARRFKQ